MSEVHVSTCRHRPFCAALSADLLAKHDFMLQPDLFLLFSVPWYDTRVGGRETNMVRNKLNRKRGHTERRRVSGTGKTIILISYRVVRVPALRGEIMNERFSPFCVACVSWKRKVTVRLRCRLDFGNKRARGEDAYCFDWHGKGRFSPFLLLGQEAWKKRIFQRDYKGKNYNAIRKPFQLVCAKNAFAC